MQGSALLFRFSILITKKIWSQILYFRDKEPR